MQTHSMNTLEIKTNISNSSNTTSGKRVFVGMSGGVDSSVSAALLKESGYNVTGVFIKSWHPDFMPCNWKDERRDAMRVAATLGISFLTCDLEQEYKKEVIDYMIEEYKVGRTPNPDVMCNKHIKFGAFFEWAMGQDADYIATGHYAQVFHKQDHNSLVVSKDTEKDQTYFLWTLTEESLSKTLFPIGHLKKKEVRTLARKFKLPTAQKKDSQGLCFLGKVNMQEFLSHYIEHKKGNVLNAKGEVIGEHDGALFYTLGERHGFHISHKSPDDRALYVVNKDLKNNTITVSDSPKSVQLKNTEYQLDNVILRDYSPHTTLYTRYRYRQALFEGRISDINKNNKNNTCVVMSEHISETIAPGQSIVFYQETNNGLTCIGGGIVN